MRGGVVGEKATLWSVLIALGCTGEDEAPPAPPVAVERPLESATPSRPTSAPATPVPRRSSSAAERRCREQPPQDFLLRRPQIAKVRASSEERRSIEAARKRAIDYRTRQYGYFSGFGSRRDNPHPPSYYATRTTFMGLPLVVHEKIVPALACVETALLRECTAHPYRPRTASASRYENTYKDYEVSNHVFGIAIDIDSQSNPCCGCVGRWREHEACKKKVDSVFDRMAMPRCWVEVFERHGFYWLGHDELQDTMHLEFLGDPERIFE